MTLGQAQADIAVTTITGANGVFSGVGATSMSYSGQADAEILGEAWVVIDFGDEAWTPETIGSEVWANIAVGNEVWLEQ